jgi:hypothetical protein
LNATITSPDVLNSTSTSLLDVKKTAVVAATAALITAQALQNQMHNPSTNGTIIDGNNPSTWTTTPSQPVMLLPP